MGDIIKRLNRRKKLWGLIIIQVAISFSLINIGTEKYLEVDSKKGGFSDILNLDTSYMMNIRGIEENRSAKEGGLFAEAASNEIEKFLLESDVFYDLKGIGKIENVILHYTSPNRIEELEEYFPEKLKRLEPYEKMMRAANIVVNEDFLANNNIEVVKGRTLTVKDINMTAKKEVLPILLGNHYIDKVELGHEFTATDNTKLKVVGFMKKNAIVASRQQLENYTKDSYYEDTFVVVPVVPPLVKDNEVWGTYDLTPAVWDLGYIVELSNINDKNEVEKKLNEELNKYGLETKLESLSLGKNMVQAFEYDTELALITGGVFLIISILGISSLVVLMLKKRKEEFKIKLAIGAEKKDIIKEVLQEIIIANVIGIILSRIFSIGIAVNYKIIIINLIIIFINTALISLVAILNLEDKEIFS